MRDDLIETLRGEHRPEEWGPSDNRRLTCAACGADWPCNEAELPPMHGAANLVEADATGSVYPNTEAVAFADAAAAVIKAKLVAGAPEFALMPYRHNGNYLGFDWIDAQRNSISIVFYTTPDASPLPTRIDPEGADVGVQSWVDALLLIRMIAKRVKGNSVGEL